MGKGGSFGGGGKFGARSSQRAADSRTSISKPGAGGPTPRPAGDNTIARYNGLPMDRLAQVGSIVGGFFTGPIGAVAGGMLDEVQNGAGMTQPDGYGKFGKAMDTQGGVGQMERLRRRRYAAQVGNSLGIADTSLGA